MRVPRLSPAVFRRLTLVNLVLLIAIIVSGATVRLTNSGLGCADWPNCSATKLVDVSTHHAAIEQLNRIFSGAIGVPIALALLAAYWRVPRRRDLVALAWVLFALFWAEAVLGGISVMVRLAWVSVMGHFLLALLLVGVALEMHRRAREHTAVKAAAVSAAATRCTYAIAVLTVWVLVWGTLVTAAGPHGGDVKARRLGVPLVDVARIHGASVDVLLVLVAVLIGLLWRSGAPATVTRSASITIAVMAAQAVIGYVQYFEEIPSLLVGFHVFGAVMVFITVVRLVHAVHDSRPASAANLQPRIPGDPDLAVQSSR